MRWLFIAVEIIRFLSIYWILHLFFSAFLERKNYKLRWLWVGALAHMAIFFALGVSDNYFINFAMSYTITFAIAIVFYKEWLVKLASFSIIFNFIGIMADLFVVAVTVSLTYTYLVAIDANIAGVMGLAVNAVIFAFILFFRKLFKGKRYYDSMKDLLTMTSFQLLSAITMITMFRLLAASEIPIAEYVIVLFILPALLFSSIFLFFQYNNAARRKELEMELIINKEMEQHRKMLIEQHERSLDEKSAIIHDYKSSIIHLSGVIDNPDIAKAYCKELVDSYSKQMYQYSFDVNNEVLNVILSKLKYDCEQHNITLDLKIRHSDFSLVKPVDTSNLFGNLFDNAISACCMMAAEDRWISVTMSSSEYFLHIEISNSKCNKIVETGSSFMSTKRDQRKKGSGISIIKAIAVKYKGGLNITHDKDSFTCNIFLSKVS